jgi:hypothetical protein
MSSAERFNGHLAAHHHQFLSAHMFGRIDGIDAEIARDPRADRGAAGPFHVEEDLGHESCISASSFSKYLAHTASLREMQIDRRRRCPDTLRHRPDGHCLG